MVDGQNKLIDACEAEDVKAQGLPIDLRKV